VSIFAFRICRLYWVTKQASEKQGSGLMKANAWHHRADAISSVVALIGVGIELKTCFFERLLLFRRKSYNTGS